MAGNVELGYVSPHDENLEIAVLGAILIEQNAINVVASVLDSDCFYHSNHQKIWGSIYSLFKDGNPIDLLTVMDRLKVHNVLDEVGGPSYLASLTNMVGSAANIEYHSQVLRQMSIGRKLIERCQETIKKIAYEKEDIPDTLFNHQDFIFRLGKSGSGAQSTGIVAEKMLEHAKVMYDRGGEMIGTPLTGLPSLDKLIGGYEPGDVIIFGGRPKSGKSSVGSNILKYHVENRIPVYSASGEMQNLKTGFRLAAAMSHLPTRYLESGSFFKNQADDDSFSTALEKIESAPAWLEDMELSVPKMITTVHHYFYNHGVKLFLYDRIGLFKEVLNSRDDFKARMEVTGAMRQLANKLGIAIIAFSQVNTDAEKTTHKRPEARHLFGGIGAQSNCTKAALVYRPGMYGMSTFQDGAFKEQDAKGMAEIYTVLNNYMETGSALLQFHASRQIFSEPGGTWEDDLPAQIIQDDGEDLPF